MSGTGGVVFGIAGLLALIAFLPRLAARLRLPYTVLLAGLGCALGLAFGPVRHPARHDARASVLRDFFVQLRQFDITADILLWVFLPILLFDTATKLDGRELLDDLGPILILAVVAVLMTTAAAGLAVWAVSGCSLAACLLVAAIIATTDPSAVTAVFREVGARRRLILPGRGREPAQRCRGDRPLHHAAGPGDQPRPRGRAAPSSREIALDLAIEFVGGALVGAVLGRVAADRGQPDRPGRPGRGHAQRGPGLPLLCAVGELPARLGRRGGGRRRARLRHHRPDARRHQGMAERQRHLDPARLLGELARVRAGVDAGARAPFGRRPAPSDPPAARDSSSARSRRRALCLWGVLPIVRMLLRQRPISSRFKLVILWGGRARCGHPGAGLGRQPRTRTFQPTCDISSRCSPPASSCSRCWSRPPRCAR